MKRTIFCYGDSLTWGYKPEDGSRFPYDQRWTGLLQELLGGDCRVIEQGFNGRTTVFD